MNIQDIGILLDRKLDEKLDTKLNQQRQEYERCISVALEQSRSESKMGFEVLNGRIDGLEGRLNGLEDRFDSLEEKVDSVQEMVAQNTEDIIEIKDSLRVRVR